MGVNAPGWFRYMHVDDSEDYLLSFDGAFAQDYMLGPNGWTTSGPWLRKLFGYPLES
ncbi:MAG: hypothetical protein GY747_10610 [Planctomycetes bacterium]|nr:hypothetical protein [Planctomycetota bacterium]MCP4772077.1 hypothetical protein [Planctomycetota bacterium]MCP4860794.1 hypothetical protein [Planctomycetota bacterium]